MLPASFHLSGCLICYFARTPPRHLVRVPCIISYLIPVPPSSFPACLPPRSPPRSQSSRPSSCARTTLPRAARRGPRSSSLPGSMIPSQFLILSCTGTGTHTGMSIPCIDLPTRSIIFFRSIDSFWPRTPKSLLDRRLLCRLPTAPDTDAHPLIRQPASGLYLRPGQKHTLLTTV